MGIGHKTPNQSAVFAVVCTRVLLQVRIVRSCDQLVYSTRIQCAVSELLCWTFAVYDYFYWLLLFYTNLYATLYWSLTAVIMLIARSKWGSGHDFYFQVTGDVCIIQGSIEGWPVLSWLVNVGWFVILAGYQHILQMFSTAARL